MADKPKKPEKGKKKDAHTSGFLIRMPEAWREPMRKLKAVTLRNMTTEVQLAMAKHLKEHGIESPAPS